MRRIVLATFAASILFAAGTLTAQRAEAMPVAAPLAAVTDADLLQQAAYDCLPIWRCGRYGCGWRQVCFWTPYPRYYGGPGWRHRHWRHHW
jgi:hypothetical protein